MAIVYISNMHYLSSVAVMEICIESLDLSVLWFYIEDQGNGGIMSLYRLLLIRYALFFSLTNLHIR